LIIKDWEEIKMSTQIWKQQKKVVIAVGIVVLLFGLIYIADKGQSTEVVDKSHVINNLEEEQKHNPAVIEMFTDSTQHSEYNFEQLYKIEEDIILQDEIEVYIKDDYRTIIFKPLTDDVKLIAGDQLSHKIEFSTLYKTIKKNNPDADIDENRMHGFRFVLLEGITEIDDEYFKECYPMNEVILPSTLEKIGKNSFADGYLTAVKMQDGVKTLGEGAFRNNPINHLRLSSTIKEIPSYAFENSAYDLYRLYIPEGVEKIKSKAFATTEDVKNTPGHGAREIFFPETLTTIEEQAFLNHQPIIIRFSEGLEYIGEKAFYGEGFEINKLPTTLQTVKDQAFKGPYLSESPFDLLIPKGMKEIGYRAFDSVDMRIAFAERVEELVIDEEAFYGNISDTIIIPSGVKEIRNGAFYGEYLSLVEMEEGIKTFAVDAFIGSDDLPSITLPESIETFIPAKSNEDIKNLLFAFHHTDFEIQGDKESELLEKVKESGTGLYEYRGEEWIDQYKIEEEEDESKEDN